VVWTALSLRFGIALLATLTVWLSPLDGTAKRLSWEERLTSEHSFSFRTNADAVLTEWALERFERARLHLPPLEVTFHDDLESCGGNFGLYRAGAPDRVDICGFNWDRFVVTAKRTLLHELGHAWTQYNLTDDAREQFLALRDLDTWGDDGFPWKEQGSEQAAEIIAWALIDQELQLAISDADPENLSHAYAQLTGSLPSLRESEIATFSRSGRHLDVK